jgi:hypothetical protein
MPPLSPCTFKLEQYGRFIERRLAQAQILLTMVAPLGHLEFRRPLMLLQPNLYVGFPAGSEPERTATRGNKTREPEGHAGLPPFELLLSG